VSRLFEAALDVEHETEDAGAFHLAYSMLASLRTGFPEAPARCHGWALSRQARIARQLGELDAADEMYRMVDDLAHTSSLPELTARAAYGLGGVHISRGNFPAATFEYERALAAARVSAIEELIGLAHRGLLIVHAKRGAYDQAIRSGWAAFERATGDRTSQAELLANLAAICDLCDQHEHAFAAYLVAALWAGAQRVRLPSLGGAALAAAHLGNRRDTEALVDRIEREIAAGAPPYEAALTLMDVADAFEVLGDPRGRDAAERTRLIAAGHRYYEIEHLAQEALARAGTPARGAPRALVELSGEAESVLSSISSLAVSTSARATLVGISEG
jgi:tetratricopeptide (TPR) repeat protein